MHEEELEGHQQGGGLVTIDVAASDGRGGVSAPVAGGDEGDAAFVSSEPVSDHAQGAEGDEDDEHV